MQKRRAGVLSPARGYGIQIHLFPARQQFRLGLGQSRFIAKEVEGRKTVAR